MTTPPPDETERALEAALSSRPFARAPRLREMLAYLVRAMIHRQHERMTEKSLALDVFGRRAAEFDATLDPIVRVAGQRLRRALARYYETDGADARLRFEIAPGSYRVDIVRQAVATDRGAEAARLIEQARTLNLTQAPGNYALAEAFAAKATEVDAQSVEAWFTLAMVRYSRLGDIGADVPVALEQVGAPLRRALEIDPRHAAALSLHAFLLVLDGWQWEPALAAAEWASRLAPEVAGVRARLGHLQLCAGRSDEAVETYRQVVALAPQAPPALTGLSYALAAAGDFTSARAVMDEAVRDLGRLMIFDDMHVYLAMAEGRLGDAEHHLAGLQDSGGVLADVRLAELRGLQGDRSAAWSTLARVEPKLARQYRSLARLGVAACAGDLDLAFTHARESLPQPCTHRLLIRADRLLDPLWRDPRSADLRRSMRLGAVAERD